jgi:hypothetical protein
MVNARISSWEKLTLRPESVEVEDEHMVDLDSDRFKQGLTPGMGCGGVWGDFLLNNDFLDRGFFSAVLSLRTTLEWDFGGGMAAAAAAAAAAMENMVVIEHRGLL